MADVETSKLNEFFGGRMKQKQETIHFVNGAEFALSFWGGKNLFASKKVFETIGAKDTSPLLSLHLTK